MANVRVLGTSHADGVTFTAVAGADVGTLPWSNVLDTDVQKTWRSTDLQDQTREGDFGESKNVSGVHLENVNASASAGFVLQLSDDDFATCKYAEPFQKWSKDLTHKAATLWLSGSVGGATPVDADSDYPLDADSDYALSTSYSTSIPVSARYMRILAVDPDNTDSYMEIGRMKVGEYFDGPSSPNVEVGPDFSYQPRAPLIETRGGGFRAEQKTRRRQVQVSWPFAKDADNWNIDAISWAEILEHVGYEDDMVISVYPGEATDRERRHTVLGRMTDNTGLRGDFTTVESGSIKLHSRLSITVSEAI